MSMDGKKFPKRNTQTWLQTEAHVVFSFGKCLKLQAPKYINLKTKTVLKTQKNCFVNRGVRRPYYGPFIDSD